MTNATAKGLFSYIFLFIFFAKMVISVAPLIAKSFDKEAINAVIMQLELEHNAKEVEVEKKMGKEIGSDLFAFNFEQPILHLQKENYYPVDVRHDQHYFPAVPTPPP